MRVNKELLFSFLYIVIFLAFQSSINAQEPSIQTSSITYYSVGDVITARNSDLNQGRGMHIIQLKQLQLKYLFAELKPSDQSKFLQIALYMYRGVEKTPFKVCKNEQVDSCFVSQNDLTKNSQLLVIVDCKEACQYSLRLYWSNLEHLKPGDNIKFMFAQQKAQIYHMELQKEGQFAQLRLILKPETRRQMFDRVKIYGKYGTDQIPSPVNYDFKSMHLWLDAEGIYLEKQQIKNKTLNILIIGQSQTVYFLTCQVVNKTTHDIYPGEILDQYLQPQQQATYHLNFTKSGQISFQQYVFKFSAFNGNLSLGFYTDAQFKKQYLAQPYEYMSDDQIVFDRQQILANFPNGLFLKTKSYDRISTYMMQFIGRSKQTVIQLKQNIYQITQVEYQKPKFLFFNSYFFDQQETFQQNYTFTIHLINVKGSHGIAFRICQNDFVKCLDAKLFESYSQTLEVKRYDEIGAKKTYRIQVPKTLLTAVNTVEKKLTVLMIVNNIENGNSVFALEYYADSKFQILRQSRPIQSRLKRSQQKMYKFTNVDKKIKQIKIHINKISGSVSVVSLRTDPDIQNDGRKQFSNIVSVTDKLTQKPVYLIIMAQQESIISLNVQLIHQNQDNIASITMQEDIQFTIKIPPLRMQFLQIYPIYESIYFDYKSSGLALVCEYQNNKCKKQIPEMGVQGSIVSENFKGRNQMIMVQNPSDSKSIQFKAIYHSSDYEHCEHKKIGVIYTEIIQEKQCFSFPLTKVQQIEIFMTRLDLGEIDAAFLLCNSIVDLKHQDEKSVYIIDNSTMQKHCGKEQHKVLLVVISGEKLKQYKHIDQTTNKTDQKVTKAKAKISVQYINQGAILISDGIAYSSSKISKQQALQVFYYEVINKVNTSIILTNTIGNAYFTVKVVSTVDRNKYLTDTSFDFTSTNTNYFMTPVVTIPSNFLIYAKCNEQCTLVIKVFSKEKIGARNDFSLEVTQNYFVLQEHKMKSDFLTKDAISYYSFVNKEAGNSLLIQTSDHNKKCTKIILSGKEYPSENNNYQIEYGNQLVYQTAQQKTYFIAVQALQNCAYQISVSTTKTHITLLQRGKLGYLKLKKGQVKFFMFHRLNSNPFKILSNHVYGQIQFYLNKTSTQQIQKLVKQQKIQYSKFKTKGEFKNRLIMDENLCQNCYYILACFAKKQTDTVIYLGDSESFLTISEKKSVNDLLKKKGQSLKGYYYEIQQTLVKVKVHSGKLGVKVTYYDQQYYKEFQKKDDMYLQTFKLKRKQDDWTPALVELTALHDETVYSIRMQTKQSSQYSNTVDELQIIPGEPNYMYMTSDKVYCLRGYLRDIKQSIMITADEIYEHGLNQLKIQAVLNGTEVKYTKEIIRNILRIRFDIQLEEGKQFRTIKYGICLSSKDQSFSATAFQTEDVSIIPADVEAVSYGNQVYAIRPEGHFMIDVFECVGKTNITYAPKLSALNNSKMNTLDILGFADQPHAFKISQFETTFLKIDAQMAIVRWLPIDQKKEIGLGYLQYKVGTIKYSSTGTSVVINWEGLNKKGQVHSKVTHINYNIYISNKTEIVENAQNCDYYVTQQQILIYRITVDPNNSLGVSQTYQVKKSQLQAKFDIQQNLYMSIVADVQIQPKQGDLQDYRFLYTKQQIPKEVFQAVQDNEYLNKLTYIGMIAAAIFAFLIFTWVCTKKIIPLLARLKNRMLIEQQDPKNKNQELGDVPPPSSERKAIQMNAGTQDKMSDQIQKK